MTPTERRYFWYATVFAVAGIAWLLGACGGGAGWHAPTRAELPAIASMQHITKRAMYNTQHEVPPGWLRIEDGPTGPYYFLFSDQGYACKVSAEDFVMAFDGDEWLCVWRRWR